MGMGWSLRQVVVLGALAGLVGCHEPGQVRSVEAAATMDQDALDFGEVPVGEWSERVVRLRNVGYVPFSALDALNLEGNPSYEVRFEGQGRVGPGEEKEVLVRFRPLAEGPTSETLRVSTDANLGREHTLAVKGQGIPARIEVEPRVLDFQTLEVDSERTLTFTVKNPGELPLTVTMAEDAGGAFGADTVTIPPLSSRQVSVRWETCGRGWRCGPAPRARPRWRSWPAARWRAPSSSSPRRCPSRRFRCMSAPSLAPARATSPGVPSPSPR